LSDSNARQVGRILVYLRWARRYLTPIQVELHSLVDRHFPFGTAAEAGSWTVVLLGATGRDVGIIAYMVVRGLILDAGYAARRSLENVGVLSGLWRVPEKADSLSDNEEFRRAFVWESDRKAKAALKASGVHKRFESCVMPEGASQLYSLLSKYSVHGGSPDTLASAEIVPTSYSCMLVNRPDPANNDLGTGIQLIGNACEMLMVEIAGLLGVVRKKYGLPPSEAGEGGRFISQLLDKEQMAALVHETLQDLKWYPRTSAS